MGDTSYCTGALVLTCLAGYPCEMGESGDFHVQAAKFEYSIPLTCALVMFQCPLLKCSANLGGLTGAPAHLLSLFFIKFLQVFTAFSARPFEWG